MSEHKTPKPTIKLLYYLLGKISHRWYLLGMQLKLPGSDLKRIEAKFEGTDLRMIELFDQWIERASNCTWSTIIEALQEMKEISLADTVNYYIAELGRIERSSSLKYCKVIYPLEDICYEDVELKKCYFETDKLSRVLEYDSSGEEMRKVIESLQCKNLYWYEIGILMGISKRRLDEIKLRKEERLGFSGALSLMVEALFQECQFTWKVVIDALLDMNFNVTAESVEDLVLKGIKFPNCTKTTPTRYSRSHFNSSTDILRTSTVSKDKLQRYVKKICDILQLQIINSEDVLENLYSHIVSKNPNHTQLKSIAELVEKISKLSNAWSDDLAEQAKQLKDDIEVVKRVKVLLKQEKRELETRKTTLEYSSKEIREEIEKIRNSRKKVKLQNLNRLHQEILNKLQEICDQLNDCIKKLDQANANYNAINEQLSTCKITASICKRQLGSCKTLITNLQLHYPINFEIDAVLQVIQNSYEKIAEVQRVLDEAEKPYQLPSQPTQVANLQIFVMSNTSSDIFSLDVRPTSSIKELKHEIKKILHVPITHQFISFADNELGDDSIISDYNIHTHSLFHLSLGMEIRVKGSGEDMTLLARESDTIGTIKKHIHDRKSNIPLDTQCLLYRNEQLEDEHTLSFYGIKKKHTLHLSFHMKVCVVVASSGKEIILSVLNSDTVKAVKNQIHEKEGILPNQQLLIFAGMELKDTDCLFYHKSIQSISTLQLIIKTDVAVVNESCVCTII